MRNVGFKRGSMGDGEGVEGVNPVAGWIGRRLRAKDFPSLLLRREWPVQGEYDLVADFLGWQAPLLLELQNLAPELREALEQQACRQALKVAAQYRLYPEIRHAERITAALEEARLRRAGEMPAVEKEVYLEETLTPFYRE